MSLITRFILSIFFCISISISAQTAPKTTLQNGELKVSFQFPSSSTAPKTWEEFSALIFPSEQNFALKIPTAIGYYVGPDGGAVYQWGPGFYKWDLLEGINFVRRSTDEWSLEKGNFKVHSFPRKCQTCSPEKLYIFPDLSQINASYQEIPKKTEYFYEDVAKRNFFRFYEPGRYGKLSEQKGKFDFQFSSRDSLFVHAFQQTSTLEGFFRKAEKDFDLVASSKILVTFFQEVKGFREFNNLPNAACSGGRGGIFGISFCDPRPEKDYFQEDSDSEIRKYQYSTQFLHMLFHETIHHMQQVRCRILREGKTLPETKQPDWLVEGHAEFMAQYGTPKFKGTKYREFYENFIQKKGSFQIEKTNPYLSGFIVMDYISGKYGNSKIKDLFDKTCQGEEINSALQSTIGLKVSQLQSELSNFFESEKELLPSKFLTWEIEGSLPFDFVFSEAEDFSIKTLLDLGSLNDPAQIPDIRKLFSLQLEKFKGKMEGTFHSPRKEKVFLFKNGTYRIETPTYMADVFPDGTVTFKSDKTSITVWSTGIRKWESGGKSLIYFPPKL